MADKIDSRPQSLRSMWSGENLKRPGSPGDIGKTKGGVRTNLVTRSVCAGVWARTLGRDDLRKKNFIYIYLYAIFW